MSTIFISHSSADNALAKDLAERLEQQNHTCVFLDLDPEKGIIAGESWERTLYRKLRACRAVIAICTDSYLKSQWCFAEIALARMEGKQIIALKADPLRGDAQFPTILSERQFIDLRKMPDDGYRRLWRGLKELDLLGIVGDWDISHSPYLGLSAYHERHAPVFFGRETEIRQGIELLDRGAPGLVMVLGASGSGKSSLARAGVVPRLRGQEDRWLITDPFRPGHDPFGALAQSLCEAFRKHAPDALPDVRDWEQVRRRLGAWSHDANSHDTKLTVEKLHIDDRLTRLINELEAVKDTTNSVKDSQLRDFLNWSIGDLRRIFQPDASSSQGKPRSTPLTELAYQLRRTSGNPDARILLIIDQFEELLGTTGDPSGQRLLALIATSLAVDSSLLTVFVTMRSDFLETFQTVNATLRIDFETMSLGPVPIEGIRRIIEAPAKLGAITLEAGLADRLLKDANSQDALPLLSFTLWLLWRDGHASGTLTIADYDRLGGLNGAIAGEADAIHKIATEHNQQNLLKIAFQSMVRLADDGQYARTPVPWDHSDLVPVHDLLETFIERRLLITRVEDDVRVVEVAHEALFRTWGPLRAWTEEQRAELVLRQQLLQTSNIWNDDARKVDYLWHGARLAQAVDLLEMGKLNDKSDPANAAKSFVQASEAMRIKRARRSRNLSVAVATVLIGLLAYAVWNEDEAKRQQRASWSQEQSLAANRDLDSNPMNSVATAQRAVCLTHMYDGVVLESAHNALNRAVQAVHSQRSLSAYNSSVSQLMFLPNSAGAQGLVTLGQDHALWQWPEQGADRTCAANPTPAPLSGVAQTFTIDPLGRFIAYGAEKSVYLSTSPKPAMTWPDDVATIVISPNGTYIAAIDSSGTVLIATLSSAGEIEDVHTISPPGSHTTVLALSNGLLAVGGWDGPVTLWNVAEGKQIAQLTGHTEAVTSIIFQDQQVVTTSWDKTVRVWDASSGSLRQTLNHQAAVSTAKVVARAGKPYIIVSASWDNTVRIWDAESGAALNQLDHGSPVLSLAIAPERNGANLQFATGGWDGKTTLWTVYPEQNRAPAATLIAEQEEPVNDIAFSPDGSLLASGSDDATIKLSRLTDAADDLNWQSSLDLFNFGSALSPENWVAVMVAEGVQVLETASGDPRRLVTGYQGIAHDMAFSDDEGARKLVIRAGDVFEYYLDEGELMMCARTLSGQSPPESATLTELCATQQFDPNFQSLLSRVRSIISSFR